MKLYHSLLKSIAIFTLITFTCQQVIWAAPEGVQDFKPSPGEKTLAEVLAEQSDPASEETPYTSQDFLIDTLNLTSVNESENPKRAVQRVERTRSAEIDSLSLTARKRVSLTEALESGELRKDYAAAVILEDLSVEDIEFAISQEFEIAIVVLEGEIVAFSTGNDEKIGVLAPALEILKKAVFASHTHVREDAQDGPSQFDFQNAVSEGEREYVLTREGAYVYNQSGPLNQGRMISLKDYRDALILAQHLAQESSEVSARALLNHFIYEMDRYNEATFEDREVFRASGIDEFTDDFNRSNLGSDWLTISGNWHINSSQTKLTTSNAANNYNMKLLLDQELLGDDYDITLDTYFTDTMTGRGILFRYTDLDNYYYAKFTRKNEAIIIKRVNGVNTTIGSVGGAWLAKWSWHDMRLVVEGDSIQFYTNGSLRLDITDSDLTTGSVGLATDYKGVSFDDFDLQVLNSIPSVDPPTVNALPEFTNQSIHTLSGTKPANTSIWINGTEMVALDSETTWSYDVTLTEEQLYSFSITAKDVAGTESSAVQTSATYDMTLPEGAIAIDQGDYTNVQTIDLTLTTDELYPDQMRFLISGGNPWGDWIAFSQSHTLQLGTQDGPYTVQAEYQDRAGNVSTVTIQAVTELDQIPPVGSLEIDGGAGYAQSHTVTLTINQTETNPDQMQLSLDGGQTWLPLEAYQSSKEVNLPATEGSHNVQAKLIDKAGNASSIYSDAIIVDTIAPAGTLAINNDDRTTTSRNASLTLTASDAELDPLPVRYSVDGGLTWTEWEAFSTSRAVELSDGYGTKEVIYEIRDVAGHVTAISETIVLMPNTSSGASEIIDDFNRANLGSNWVSLKGNWVIENNKLKNHDWSGNGWSLKAYFDQELSSGDYTVTADTYFGNDSLWRGFIARYQDADNYYWAHINRFNEVKIYKRENGTSTLLAQTSGSWFAKNTWHTIRFEVNGDTLSFYIDDLENPRLQTQDSTFTSGKAGLFTQYKSTLYDDFTVVPLNVSSGPVILQDGTELYYGTIGLEREATPSGDEVTYRADGSVEKYTYADGIAVHYLQDTNQTIEIYDDQQTLIESIDQPAPTDLDLSEALEITLEGGLRAYYIDGALVEFRTVTGIRVTDFTLDQDENIVDAYLVYPDSAIDILRRGVLIRRISADDSILDLTPAQLVIREIGVDSTQIFSYEKASQTDILETRITSSNGDRVVYDDLGMLIRAEDGTEKFIYRRETVPPGSSGNEIQSYKVVFDASVSAEPDETTMVETTYDLEGVITGMTLQDQSVITFDAGRLVSVVDDQGAPIADYSFLEESGFLEGLQVSREGAVFHYGQGGFLETIVTDEGTIRRTAEDTDGDGDLTDEEIIELILESLGGHTLSEFELDPDGNILNGIIETKEGIKQTIENGVLTGFETVDGRIYDYANDEAILSEWHFQDGTRVVYGGGSISEILFPDGSRLHTIGFTTDQEINLYTEELTDGTQKIYARAEDGTLRLLELTAPDGTQIFYGPGGLADRVLLADATEQTVVYSRDAETGEVSAISFESQNARHTFTPEGELLSLLQDGVNAEFETGEVTRLFTRFGAVDAPAFDQAGILTGDITFEDGTTLVVEAGELIQATRPSGSTVNYVAGRMDSISTTNHTYTFLYEDGVTQLDSVRIRLDSVAGTPEIPLIPFLENPDEMLAVALKTKAPEVPTIFYDDAAVSTDEKQFGEGAFAFDGAGDYLQIEQHPDYDFGTGDFTIEAWVNVPSGTTQNITVASKYDSNDGWIFFLKPGSNAMRFHNDTSGVEVSANLQYDIWQHVAVVKEGGVLKFFLDGVQQGTDQTAPLNVEGADGDLLIGMYSNISYFNGAMDEVRISNIARWNADFTPDATAYLMDYQTVLLLHADPASEPDPVLNAEAQEIREMILARPVFNSLKQNAQSIVESSITGHTFESNGDAARSEVDPKFAASALTLDGAGDYLEVTDHDDFDLGAEDFTIDTWIKPNVIDGYHIIAEKFTGTTSGYTWYLNAGGELTFYAAGGALQMSTTTKLVAGEWAHIALSRSGDTWKIFINGVEAASATGAYTLSSQASDFRIGSRNGSSLYLDASLDDFRVTENVARWTENFSVPTAEAVRDEDTALLLHFEESEWDLSAEVIEADVKNAVYFAELAGDYERAGALEFGDGYFPEWLGLNNIATYNQGYVAQDLSVDVPFYIQASTSRLVDMNGDGLKDRVYIDEDALVGYWWVQFNDGNRFEAPVKWEGVVQNIGVNSPSYPNTHGAIRYFDNLHPHVIGDLFDINGDGLPDRVMQDTNGTQEWFVQINNGSGFDPVNANATKPVSAFGDTHATETDMVFGQSSAVFDGAGDFLTTSDSEDFDFADEDFTIEAWVKFEGDFAGSKTIFSQSLGSSGTHFMTLGYSADQWYFDVAEGNYLMQMRVTDNDVALNEWTHVALVREGDTFSVYRDGTLQGTHEQSITIPDYQNAAAIGVTNLLPFSANSYFEGKMDEVRVSHVARWSSDFTPETEAYESDADTAFLLHMDGDEGSQGFLDSAKASVGYTNAHPATLLNDQAKYGSQIRDDAGNKSVQEIITDMIDLDGDGLVDRVLRPAVPNATTGNFDHWFFQKNLGAGRGFADTMIWEGVDDSFDTDQKIAGSLSWYKQMDNIVADASKVIDMNGDGLPDRLLLKNEIEGDTTSALDWYIQINNGDGFDAAVLFDDEVRVLPGLARAMPGTAINAFYGWAAPRNILTDLVDVTGDGLPDRVTVDSHNLDRQTSWWVEVNTGLGCDQVQGGEPCGFDPAVEWINIYGTHVAESVIGQDASNFRSNMSGPINQVTQLTDINGDDIPDRVIYPEGELRWLVQYGTGSGFLPIQELQVDSLEGSSSSIVSSRYDYLHVSLRADQDLPVTTGSVKVILSDSEGDQGPAYQEWTVEDLTADWQDFYLSIDAGKPNASKVQIEYVPVDPEADPIPIYVDSLTFTTMRPPSGTDWLTRLLTSDAVLAGVDDSATETLASYLGLSEATDAADVNWNQLLAAETRIAFDTEGEAEEFETLYGSVSQIEDGYVTQTVLPDGTVIEFEAPDPQDPNNLTQTVTHTDGSTETLSLNYGRVRSITEQGETPLEYSYEFDELGREITVVRDPDTEVEEHYRDEVILGNTQSLLVAREEANGVVTSFLYNDIGELVRSEVSYKGRVRNTFYHGKTDDDLTTLTTEEGILEAYDAEGNIQYHITPEGLRYDHSFVTAREVVTDYEEETVEFDDGSTLTVQVPVVTLQDCTVDCEDVHRISLSGFSAEDGTLAQYGEDVTGALGETALKGLLLTDGTRMSFNKMERLEGINSETGEAEVEIHLLDATVFHNDGSVTEYRDGNPYSVTSATGEVVDLTSDRPDAADAERYLVTPTESAVFHYQQAIEYFGSVIFDHYRNYQLDAGMTVQSEFTLEGDLVTRTFAEGSVQLYNENGDISQTIASTGERLVVYTYDAEGNPIDIDMEGARRNLEVTERRVRAEIEIQREEALARLAQREQVIDETIEGQYLVTRDRLLEMRAQLESKRGELITLTVGGKGARELIGDALSQIQVGLNQVNGALEDLARNRAEALEELEAQVAQMSLEIQTQAAEALVDLENAAVDAKQNLIRQELTPVIYHWYRHLLGRDPNQAEFDYWYAQADLETGDFDVEILKADLLNSQELVDRTAEVQAIQNHVEADLSAFLAMSDAEKLVFAAALGITQTELIDLSSAEAQIILDWLNTRSLHFGQSAFLTLEALLDDASISYVREDLATNLILIDILTGTITTYEIGDLLISQYALRLVAADYGLDLTSYWMTYDALAAMFEVGGESAIGAHIDNNHYIIITAVTADSVTFTDPGAGAEDSLEVRTLSKAEFMATWVGSALPYETQRLEAGQGVILSPRAPPAVNQAGMDLTGHYEVLTVPEEMLVRGAFFGFLKKIFEIIVDTVVNSIKAIVKGIVESVTLFYTGLADILVGLVTLDFGQVLDGLKTAFLDSTVRFFQGLGEAIFIGVESIGQIFLAVGLPESIVSPWLAVTHTIVGIVMPIGGELSLQRGLSLFESLGISPKIIQTIAAGGRIAVGVGLAATGNPLAIGVGLGLIAGGTSEMLNLHTSLSPDIINLISVGASVVGAITGGALSGLDLLASQTPRLLADLSTVGLIALGNEFGIDPALSSLLSLPVRMFFNGFTGDLPPEANIEFGGAATETLSIQLAGELAGSSVLEQMTNQPGLWEQFFQSMQNSALSAVNFLSPLAQASQFEPAADFNNTLSQNGLSQTLQENVHTIFDRQTIENILGTQGGIDTLLANSTIPVTLPDQTVVNGFVFSDTTTLLFDGQNNFVGQLKNGRYEIGEFSVSNSEFVLRDGYIYEDLDGGMTLQVEVTNGRVTDIFVNEAGEAIIQIEGNEESIFIKGPDERLSFGHNFNIAFGPVQLGFELGQLNNVDIDLTNSSVPSSSDVDDELFVLVNGIRNDALGPPGYLANLKSDLVSSSSGDISEGDIITAPTFLPSLLTRILPQLGFGANLVKDVILWLMETQNSFKQFLLSSDIIASLESYYGINGQEHRQRSIVGVGYSGGFAPLMEAIISQAYNATSMVALGAALDAKRLSQEVLDKVLGAVDVMKRFQSGQVDYLKSILEEVKSTSSAITGLTAAVIDDIVSFVQGDLIEEGLELFKSKIEHIFEPLSSFALGSLAGTAVDFVVNVWGSNDILEFFGIGGYQQDIGGKTGADLLNIKIMGAEHDDYMRRPDGDAWNITVSDFVTQIVRFSRNETELEQFLNGNPFVLLEEDVWVVRLPGWNN